MDANNIIKSNGGVVVGPKLLRDVEYCLEHLFHFNTAATSSKIGVNQEELQEEAHMYLMQFQACNHRRKLKSKDQSLRDSSSLTNPHQGLHNNDNNNQKMSSSSSNSSSRTVGLGSCEYAAMTLLLSNNDAKALFASQTILSRLRRMKLEEALDWEMEFSAELQSQFWHNLNNNGNNSNGAFWKSVGHHYTSTYWTCPSSSYISRIHPPLSTILTQLYHDLLHNNHHNNLFYDEGWTEESVKGIISLYTLTTILMYIHVNPQYHHQQNIAAGTIKNNPLVSTIASAMTIIALRLIYSNTNLINNCNSNDNMGIVSLLLQTLQHVGNVVFMAVNNDNNNNNNNNNNNDLEMIRQYILYEVLATIPDAIMGQVGGARGRLSMDPKRLQQASMELQHPPTGISILQPHLSFTATTTISTTSPQLYASLFHVCEQWAKFVSLPMEFLQASVPLSIQLLSLLSTYNTTDDGSQQQKEYITSSLRTRIICYYIRIMEGASLTPSQLLMQSSGLSAELANSTIPQPGRKKQSSKSKKRHKERLQQLQTNNNNNNNENNNATTTTISITIEQQLKHRQEMATQTALFLWMPNHHHNTTTTTTTTNTGAAVQGKEQNTASFMHTLIQETLNHYNLNVDEEVDGEGPIGVLCAAITACIPHIIIQSSSSSNNNNNNDSHWNLSLVYRLMESFHSVCASPNSSVRALTYEHLTHLHKSLLSSSLQSQSSNTIVKYVINNIANCGIALASQCAYPRNYFMTSSLILDNDEDLEIERNDVRDVLRTITNFHNNTNNSNNNHNNNISMCTLEIILQYCYTNILHHTTTATMTNTDTNNNEAGVSLSIYNSLPSETVIHIISSLAKPLHQLTDIFLQMTMQDGDNNHNEKEWIENIIRMTLSCLHHTATKLVDAFTKSFVVTGLETSNAYNHDNNKNNLHLILSHMLPVARLICITTASFAPFFSNVLQLANRDLSLSKQQQQQQRLEEQTLGICILAVSYSIQYIPELIGQTSLGRTMYDIRGAMRSPGGEDHVGCIALMRLCSFSNASSAAAVSMTLTTVNKQLLQALLKATAMNLQQLNTQSFMNNKNSTSACSCINSINVTSVIQFLVGIHQRLQVMEMERGPGVWHGKGVTPKSRRILLMTISQLATIASQHWQDEQTLLTQEIQNLFYYPLSIIRDNVIQQNNNNNNNITYGDAQKMFFLCEAAFDLSSFSSNILSSLLFLPNDTNNNASLVSTCLKTLIDAGVSGYQQLLSINLPDDGICDTVLQWGRLRGSLFSLFRASANPGLPYLVALAVSSMINAECEAAIIQCKAGPHSTSNIFNKSVIGEDILPAGAYCILIRDVLDGTRNKLNDNISIKNSNEDPFANIVIADSMSILVKSKDSVLYLLSSKHPEANKTGFSDPRPTIAESWFLTLNSLLCARNDIGSNIGDSAIDDTILVHLVGETLAVCVKLLLTKQLEKDKTKKSLKSSSRKRQQQNIQDVTAPIMGMSLDGPQTLAMIDFMEKAFTMGPLIFRIVAQCLDGELKLDLLSFETTDELINPDLIGGVIITSALYRGACGALPPWVIESVPKLYESLFKTCGGVDSFCYLLHLGGTVRLQKCEDTINKNDGSPATDLINVQTGQRLVGETSISIKALDEFVKKSRQIITNYQENNSWRAFKVLLKAVCGGKKKATTFNLKPQLSCWDCDRI